MPAHRKHRAIGATTAATAALALLIGCGGPISFVDQQPIAVLGEAPAPPPPAPKRVEVKEDRIQINEKIQFELNKAVIRPESHSLLNEVAQVIKQNPRIKKLSIEGHTCDIGSDDYNQKLSDKRAAAVREYLVKAGIADAMLSSRGHGEAQPIADNGTESGKEQNRRVEFLITEQDEITKVFLEDPATGERKEVTDATQGGEQ